MENATEQPRAPTEGGDIWTATSSQTDQQLMAAAQIADPEPAPTPIDIEWEMSDNELATACAAAEWQDPSKSEHVMESMTVESSVSFSLFIYLFYF